MGNISPGLVGDVANLLTASVCHGISLASKILENYFQPVLHPKLRWGCLDPLSDGMGTRYCSPSTFQCIYIGALVPPLTQILATALHFAVIVSLALVFSF